MTGFRPHEEGQMLVLTALAMVAILGFAAMTIDVGLVYRDRRHLQNTADAAALAGTAELPQDPVAARARARDWVLKHGMTDDQIKTIEVRSDLAFNDTVYVELEQEFDWIFARALGMTTSDVGGKAAARVGTLAGGSGFVPWALLTSDVDCLDGQGNPKFGSSCVVKVGAGDATTGWYGALDTDGPGGGASEYEQTIIDGEVDWVYCIAADPAPACNGANVTVGALDGNKTGPTDEGIDQRLAQGAQCDGNGNGVDDFDEVLDPNPGGDPTYTVACPASPWLVIVPIVDYPSTPVKDVTIRGWMLAYLIDYYCVSSGGTGGCNGKGHWEVQVQIVDAAYSQSAGFLGAFDPESGIVVRRLVE